jgi:hypothetical protein
VGDGAGCKQNGRGNAGGQRDAATGKEGTNLKEGANRNAAWDVAGGGALLHAENSICRVLGPGF